MSKLYTEILDSKRGAVFENLRSFSDQGILAGGTALALQINHRKSYDFDIFTNTPVEKKVLEKVRRVFGDDIELLVDNSDELSFLTSGKVKVSFIYFPFKPLHRAVKTSSKAHTVGRRGEYRDYVDLFFLLKKDLKLEKIIKEARQRFNGAFSEKLFLEQLIYFGDLEDFTVEFIGEEYSQKQILNFFEEVVSKYTKAIL